MSNLDHIHTGVQDILNLYRNRHDLLRAADRPKIGFVSIQTPEEIILAAGAIPFRLTGDLGTNVEEASARLSSNYCSYVLSCLSEGLDGVYDFADGVIFADACDMRKRLWETWLRTIPSCESYFLELPSDASPLSKSFFAGQLRKLIKKLEEKYGRTIDDNALRDAIVLCNRSRALMQELYQYKKAGRPILAGKESIGVVKAAATGLKEQFNAKVSALLDSLSTVEPWTGRKRHRVLICGSHFDHGGIIDTIEETGVDIVCEDISNGIKYFEGQIDVTGDPVSAIADYYLEKYTSARRVDTDIRLKHLMDLIQEYRVDSVIYYVLKFCDTNLHDYPYIKENLRAKKIPVLFIEGEHNLVNIASIKTRIQTFLEPSII